MKKHRLGVRVTLLASACYLLTSCATLDQAGARHGTAIGCGVGALVGGVLGNIVGQRTGNRGLATAVGAASGAAIGCYVGNRWQKREQALQELARREHLQIETQMLALASPTDARGAHASSETAGLVANVQNMGMFALDSDQLTADGLRQARALAAIYRPDRNEAVPEGGRSVLLVVGHTDATGAAAHNQALSERRARAMGQVLADAGIDPSTIYFQGAGASRPIADNSTEQGRSQNRRVELVELSSSDLLIQRIEQERANPRYLAHGTGVGDAPPPADRARSTDLSSSPSSGNLPGARVSLRPRKTQPVTRPGIAAAKARDGKAVPASFIDFGGAPAHAEPLDLAALVRPRQSGFALVSTAFAADIPLRGCEADRPRISGEVRNLASGQTVEEHATRDYLPGMNGRAWAGLVNGNLVTLSPVAVLRDGGEVATNPTAYVTRGYSAGQRKALSLEAVANAYEGEDAILYRVFVKGAAAPVQCMDLVLRKAGDQAKAGKLYYDHGGSTYAAKFQPTRS